MTAENEPGTTGDAGASDDAVPEIIGADVAEGADTTADLHEEAVALVEGVVLQRDEIDRLAAKAAELKTQYQ